ncbi:DUF1217 domain-containing protein [Sinirhodobacter populi]|uniref:DUF1217 domain-containing protein n=1 Tax=Paenirhodobacter populi TaxID=2306993 RepID=A0A443K2Z4_9RHOB|nr:DUF1217 domain-containing protein [Sinirhodobacter populi]RWR27126.1 DUF1217 domain-containing protein [Sinirhodobacter populi]
MTYTPAIPTGGYAGWLILNRTMAKQEAAFVQTAAYQRNEDYFREKIGSITSAEELVADRRLLAVALGAFGLDDDINSKAFIRKVLAEGTQASDSLANRLSDKSYFKLAEAFGFGDYETPRTAEAGFADGILEKYKNRQFEVAVGEVNESFRFALTAQRDLPEIAAKSSSNNTKWYQIIGSSPLASFMQTALGLPTAVSSLDVDRQLEIYQQKAKTLFGTDDLAAIVSADGMDKLIKSYLVRTQLTEGTSATGQSAALQILQGTSTNLLSLLL